MLHVIMQVRERDRVRGRLAETAWITHVYLVMKPEHTSTVSDLVGHCCT